MHAEIVAKVEASFPDAQVNVELDGNRAVVEVVSTAFADMSRVRKQQAVYSCINEFIADGRLHAVTIRAEVPAA
ncbi:MAG: BolA/IbaG family iron-sulfur metabolism protein [Pseudomonadota bacterium]